jgi:hypothetical protein
MTLLRSINLAIAFLLELCMVFSLGYCGFYSSSNSLIKLALALGLPAIAIGLWAHFAAPKSKHRLANPYLIVFKLVLYFGTALFLYQTDKPVSAFILAGTATVSELFTLYFKEVNV